MNDGWAGEAMPRLKLAAMKNLRLIRFAGEANGCIGARRAMAELALRRCFRQRYIAAADRFDSSSDDLQRSIRLEVAIQPLMFDLKCGRKIAVGRPVDRQTSFRAR